MKKLLNLIKSPVNKFSTLWQEAQLELQAQQNLKNKLEPCRIYNFNDYKKRINYPKSNKIM